MSERAKLIKLETLRAVERMQPLGGRTTLRDIATDVNAKLGVRRVTDREVDRALQFHRKAGAIRYGRDGWRLTADSARAEEE